MTKENNVVLKQECHSPRTLWGIFRIRNARVVKQAKEYEEYPRTLRAATNAGYSGSSGFTLIELLVVVLIIAILVAIAVPQYQKAVLKSKYSRTKILANALASAEEMYYLTYGKYTYEMTDLDIQLTETPAKSQLIQRGNKAYYYPWGYCTLIDQSLDGMPRLGCKVDQGKGMNVGYSVYLKQATKAPYVGALCSSYGNNNLTGQVLCKLETGRSKENSKAYGWWSYYYN